ncbi:MAG: cytochrome P450 [Planctomycetes bacterium]|nr:cytochrome P450 [Planctomycetota bacterium]
MIRRGTHQEESPSEVSGPPVTEGSFWEFTADPVACMRRLHAAHGEIAIMREATQQVVFVFGPRLNHAVLSDPQSYHARFFGIRGPRNSAQRRLTAGLLSMNEEQHKRQRRLLLGSFSRKAIDGYHARLVEATEGMLAGWQAGETRDVHRDMTGLMLRITSTILFGFDQGDLACEIGQMIERWVSLNHEIGIGALVPDDNFSRRYEELLSLADELEQRIQQMIDLRRRDSAVGHDMLSILLRAHDDQGGLTDEELIGQACVLFGAAHLTSANTLSWTLLLLAQHPRVAAPLIEELLTTLDGQPPGLSDVERLPQLDRVIKESMRVLPASSYSQRITMCPVDLGPLHLPPRTPIVFSQFITHHRPDLYDDPEVFRPARGIDIDPAPSA